MQLCARAGRKAGEPPCWQNPQLDGNSAKGQMHTRTCQGHQKQLSIWHGAMLRAPLVSFWVWRCASGNFSSLVWTLEILKCIEMPKNDSIVFSAHRCANAFGTFEKTPTLSPQLGSHILTEAPCTEIIQRANSTIDYDLRDQHETLERPAKMARVCPVLWDLYHSDFNKSDTKTVINCNILHLTRVYTGHIKFRVYWQWIAIFGTSSSHMGYESTKCLFIRPHFSFKGLLCLP